MHASWNNRKHTKVQILLSFFMFSANFWWWRWWELLVKFMKHMLVLTCLQKKVLLEQNKCENACNKLQTVNDFFETLKTWLAYLLSYTAAFLAFKLKQRIFEKCSSVTATFRYFLSVSLSVIYICSGFRIFRKRDKKYLQSASSKCSLFSS